LDILVPAEDVVPMGQVLSTLAAPWHTTMSVRNFWRQLKHDYLHHLVQPWLDQLVWVIQTQVVLNYMAWATFLEDVYHIGHPKKLTPFQTGLKKEWAHLSSLELSGRSYRMDISRWQCSCKALKYNSFHLCKHLIKSIPPPPATLPTPCSSPISRWL